MSQITRNNIENWEKRYRAQFINSLTGFKSLCLVGTVSDSGQENLAVISSTVHIGSHPPLLAIILRPNTVPRHTLENIKETGLFTLNHVTEDFYQKAHQTSARYPRDISEFQAVELTPEYKDGFKAPFVKESLIQVGMESKQVIYLNINKTEMIIGEVKLVNCPESYIKEDGFIDLEKAGSLTVSGLDSYHHTQRINRLAYAKPNKNVSTL